MLLTAPTCVLAIYASASACGIALVQLGDAGPSAGHPMRAHIVRTPRAGGRARHEALLAGAWKDSSGPQSATWSGRQLWGWKSGLSAGGAAGSGLARVLAARLRTMCPRRSSHVGLRHKGVRGAVEKRESSFGEPLARHVSGRNGHPARRGRREKSTAADIWWRPTSARGC